MDPERTSRIITRAHGVTRDSLLGPRAYLSIHELRLLHGIDGLAPQKVS